MVKALPLLGEGPVFICNIDAVWMEHDSALGGLLEAWDARVMDDLLLLAPKTKTLGYHGSGDFKLTDKGQIFRRSADTAPFVYAGVQIANLTPLRAFEPAPFSRNKVWDVSLASGRAHGLPLNGFWMHVGDPKARDEAEAILEKEFLAT